MIMSWVWNVGRRMGGGGGGVGMQTSLLYVPALGSDERQLYLQDKGGLT